MNNEQLLLYLQEIIAEIHEDLAETDLSQDQKAAELIRRIHLLLDQFGVAIEKVIPLEILLNYFGGVDEATKALRDAGLSIPATLSITQSGMVATAFQSVIHTEAVNILTDNAMLDLNGAIRTAKLYAKDTINEALSAVKSDITKGVITGDPRKVIQARVAASFAKNGLTSFITDDGRELPLDFYAMTVTRTMVRNATVQGSSNRYEENDVTLVQIMENSDTCPICAKYRGLVVSLTGEPGYLSADEVKLPPYHPNCRGTIRPFVVQFKSSKEIQDAKRMLDTWDPGADPRTPSAKRAYEKEQRLRRKANEEKKQFIRWQMAMGADAPKTLGAFRRMKRTNSPKFQELQSNYRSLMYRNPT